MNLANFSLCGYQPIYDITHAQNNIFEHFIRVYFLLITNVVYSFQIKLIFIIVLVEYGFSNVILEAYAHFQF